MKDTEHNEQNATLNVDLFLNIFSLNQITELAKPYKTLV